MIVAKTVQNCLSCLDVMKSTVVSFYLPESRKYRKYDEYHSESVINNSKVLRKLRDIIDLAMPFLYLDSAGQKISPCECTTSLDIYRVTVQCVRWSMLL